MVKISIFGFAGSGTSTLSKILSKKLNLEFIYSGDMFRNLAKEKGLSLEKFSKLCEENDSFDKELDLKIKNLGKEKDNFIIDSRLAWYFIPDSFKIKITCLKKIRFERIAKRDEISFEKAKEKTQLREKSEKQRYCSYYGIKNYKNTKFNLVINSSKKSPEEIAEIVMKELEKISKK